MSFFASLHQYGDLGLLALRIGLAAIFLVHGLHKRGMWKMAPSEQLPKPLLGILRLLSICEPLGALAMLAGCLTQLAAVGMGLVMVSAIRLKTTAFKKQFTYPNGDTGWEFDFILLCAAIAVFFLGAGALSFDRYFLHI